MLKALSLQNIALVEKAELTFEKGMSVLTGETGAGKSIIVTALSLALGGRAEREYIRHGSDKAVVTAEFFVGTMPSSYRKQYADSIEDNMLVITREISRDGSSRVKIKNEVSSLGRLKEITLPLAEILGQHANQMLMHEENHLIYLDHFASLEPLRQSVTDLYEQWEKAAVELKRIVTKRDQMKSERELLLYQKSEIEKANVRVGEESELLQERKILDSARALMTSAGTIEQILDSDENSVLQQLRFARKELDKMASVDLSLEPKAAEFTDLDFQLEEMRRFIEQYGASINDDPAKLEEINLRLDEIYSLKKKFGGSEESILESLNEINIKLQDRPDTDKLIIELEQRSNSLRLQYTEKALELSDLRKKASDYLRKLTVKELSDLAIESANFEVEFSYTDCIDGIIINNQAVRPFPHGLENARFLFSANKGEPLKSLVKTASGGEISRVLLALKAAEKKNSNLQRTLLVFDEVDAGIGGRTATEVAKKLKKLSEDCQVLVVTHLHQIARLANNHYVAEKTTRRTGRAFIDVRKLEGAAIQSELGRMIALPEN